jgi:hypothetical protein
MRQQNMHLFYVVSVVVRHAESAESVYLSTPDTLPYLMIAHRERKDLTACFVSNSKGNSYKTSLIAEVILTGRRKNCEACFTNSISGRHLLPAYLHYVT